MPRALPVVGSLGIVGEDEYEAIPVRVVDPVLSLMFEPVQCLTPRKAAVELVVVQSTVHR